MGKGRLTQGMRKRAQQTADQTGSVRWINYTSLGWKVERRPSGPENLRIRIDPQPDQEVSSKRRVSTKNRYLDPNWPLDTSSLDTSFHDHEMDV